MKFFGVSGARILALLLAPVGLAAQSPTTVITTNSVIIDNAPAWLSEGLVQSTVDHVERKLEWSIRRTKARFYRNEASLLENFNGRRSNEILAFTKAADLSVHLGPRIDKSNFKEIFGHELAHVVIAQKYKTAIPAWLTEGLCNSVAGSTSLNYKWLAKQKPRLDIVALEHPHDKQQPKRVDVHYMASLAAVKMLEKKCPDFRELLNLSLRSNANDYIKTYCGIADLNATFWTWVDAEAKRERARN